MGQPFLYYYIGQGECQTVQWHVRNVPHLRAFDLTYVFVVRDWFVLGIWQETSVSSGNAKALRGFFLRAVETLRFHALLYIHYMILISYPQNRSQNLFIQNKMSVCQIFYFIISFKYNDIAN